MVGDAYVWYILAFSLTITYHCLHLSQRLNCCLDMLWQFRPDSYDFS